MKEFTVEDITIIVVKTFFFIKHVWNFFPKNMNTLRLKAVPEGWPKFIFGGLVGVNSACTNDELDVGEDEWGGLSHSSHSWFILDKAVLKRSACHN